MALYTGNRNFRFYSLISSNGRQKFVNPHIFGENLRILTLENGLHLPPLFTFSFLLTQQPPAGQGLLTHEVSRSHTTTHHSR